MTDHGDFIAKSWVFRCAFYSAHGDLYRKIVRFSLCF